MFSQYHIPLPVRHEGGLHISITTCRRLGRHGGLSSKGLNQQDLLATPVGFEPPIGKLRLPREHIEIRVRFWLFFLVATPRGFEPLTYGVEIRCSIR